MSLGLLGEEESGSKKGLVEGAPSGDAVWKMRRLRRLALMKSEKPEAKVKEAGRAESGRSEEKGREMEEGDLEALLPQRQLIEREKSCSVRR